MSPLLGDTTVLFVIYAFVGLVTSDLENYCTEANISDRFSECGEEVASFIMSRCMPSDGDLELTIADGGVFLDADQANSLLTYDAGNGVYQGVVCECCVHGCVVREFEQYCGAPQQGVVRRRRKRNTKQSDTPSKHFTDFDVAQLYNSLKTSTKTPLTNKVSIQKVEKLTKIREWKLQSIIKRNLMLMIGGEPHQSPLSPESQQIPANTAKPKIFTPSETNTNSDSLAVGDQPRRTHHRHDHRKYLFH